MMKHVFLLGSPVAHSLSPAMHNAAFRALGWDWSYELLETPRHQLPAAVKRLRSENCAGANVTIPHKQTILAWLDGLGASAARTGAVNTIRRSDGRLIGENTDGDGITLALRDARVEVPGARVLLFGAGGAARAVAFALADAGAAGLCIVNRTAANAGILAADLRSEFPDLELAVNRLEQPMETGILVNATSVGMSPDADVSPMPEGWTFPHEAVAIDLVYRPVKTKFLRDAEQAGALTVNGLGILVHQGAAAFKMWTGQDPPVDVMFRAVERAG